MKVCTGMEKVESLIVLHEGLHCVPAIIVTIFFCELKISPLLEVLPHNIIPYFIIE